MKDNDYYPTSVVTNNLVKQLAEVKDLLAEILRRLGKLEYSGVINWGDRYTASTSEKIIKVTLNRETDDD